MISPASTDSRLVHPHTLNLQAIDLCNSRCLMCHIWKDGRKEKLSLAELRTELSRPFYREVRHVGVTGGEPTLRKDLFELYELLVQVLPQLTGASFITHGMQTERTVEVYTKVHAYYRSRNLTFNGMVSLDGVGAVHDQVRGRQGAFEAATKTLLQLKANGVGVMAACTVIRSNVYGLHDLLEWGKANGVYVRFRVAEFIRRLYNEGCADQVRSFSERELRHVVCFFHMLLGNYETEEVIRRTYTSILSVLTGGERLIACPFQKGAAVNVDSRGWLACCAPKADAFAPADAAETIHTTLTAQRAEVAAKHCANCIHDYHDDWSLAAAQEISQATTRSRELYEVADESLTTPELPAQPLVLGAMKEILLAGWYGTETAGDIAILEGIINEYLAVNPQLRFQVLSFFQYYTRTTIALWPEALRERVRVIDYASEAAWQATVDCDAVVMAGGPLMDIAETRKILCLFKRFADLNKPRIIEGCGVGPLHRAEFRWNVTRTARLATQISVRDHASRENLRLYGIRKPIAVRVDPAVTYIRSQGIRHHGADQKVIRCFLRELTCEYPQATSSAQATQHLETLLRNVLAWYPEHRVELWAMHHFHVGMDDRLFAKELVQRIGNPRLVCDWEPRTPREILEAMAAAEFCICMRFHSCVFATEVGAPFVAIDYTAGGKIKAFFDDHRQPERLCTLADLPQLTSKTFAAKLRLPAIRPEKKSAAVITETSRKTPRIVHVIQNVIGGGGARAMISLAKHSARLGNYEHQLVSLGAADEVGLKLAHEANLPVLNQPNRAELQRVLAEADLVLVHWWNNVDLATLFRRELPPMRLAQWFHVGGFHSPQVLTPELIDFSDLAVACSPHTYTHPVFTSLPEAIRQQRTAMVLAGAEFDRLKGFQPRAHEGFQIGYIGTIDPVKMHAQFVDMSCAVNIPDAKFVVCGGGDARWLTDRAEQLGQRDRFDFRGHVEDIRSALATMDVYGYPLCAETYAAAELNLQEVMFAGIPVVAFPHGGIGKLIRHNETGILVNTPEEYARAIEALHQNPAERSRLGANAAAFARQYWGAENAAREFNQQFERLLTQPKRTRQWSVPAGKNLADLPPSFADRVPSVAVHIGARLLLESLADGAEPFIESLTSDKLDVIVAAEDRIASLPRMLHHNAILPYRDAYPKDAYLQLWCGLGCLRAGQAQEAFRAFTSAWENGFPHWRIHWYRALMAQRSNQAGECISALKLLLEAAPDFAPARELFQRLGGNAVSRPQPKLTPTQAAQNCIVQAERLVQAGQLAQARGWLDRALDMVPRQPDWLEALVDLDCQLGKLELARQGYDALLALEPERQSVRLEKIRETLGLKPMSKVTDSAASELSALVTTARTALSRNDRATAIAALQSATAAHPRHAGILLALGNLYYHAGNLSAAVKTLTEAAALAPENMFAQVQLARACVRLDCIPEFEAALGQALAADPNFAPAQRLLGDLLRDTQQPAEAAKHYHLALTNGTPDVELLQSLAGCLERCGETATAQALLKDAAQLGQTQSVHHESLGLIDAILAAPVKLSRAAQLFGSVGAPTLAVETPAPFIQPAAPRTITIDSTVQAPCPVCQTPAFGCLVKVGQQYHFCGVCECVFTPRIDAAVIKTENNGHSARHDQDQDAERLRRLTQALGQTPTALIDFGCGAGETTRYLQAQGIPTTGIDQDTPVQLSDVAADSIDGIMMVEVIEHLYQPTGIFLEFNRVLKIGGVVYIESSFADEKDLANWSYLSPAIGHCTLHSLPSMAKLAAQTGFGVEWINPNSCCFTKLTNCAPTAAPVVDSTPVEIIGEGIADPVVTAVISTYASEKFMRACLENLSRQTIFDRVEVIVVDSGSPENERAIVAEFQQKFPNIRYVRTPRETLYAAWNRALELARGRYFANVNTDDSLRNDALEILAASLDRHADCDMSYADCAWTTQPNDTFPSQHIVKTVKYPDYTPVEALFYCLTGCLQFFRTTTLRELGGYDATLKCAGDYEATLKIMAAKRNAVHVPEVLSLFYQNVGGLTQASNRAALEHDAVMNRYRAGLAISNIFQVTPQDSAGVAHAFGVLAQRAEKVYVPWETETLEHLEFAFTCYDRALTADPENDLSGMQVVALRRRLERLNQHEEELCARWPRMKEWIARTRAGEGLPHPAPVKYAVVGPVYRPSEWAHRPTAAQLAHEPEALRPWICRIAGRHVYLSEDLFPRPAGPKYTGSELNAAGNKLAKVIKELPPFYAHFGGAGDLLLLLAACYDQRPDAVIFSYPNSIGATQALLAAFPKLSKIYFLPQHAEPFFHIVLRYAMYELKNCLGAGATPKFGYEEEWIAGLDIEKKYHIRKAPRWAAALRQNDGSKRVAVAPKGSLAGMVGSKRNIIAPELWPQVIAHLVERGFEPVIFGVSSEAKEYPALPGCTDARGESFSGQMRLIGQCAGLVGADSWAKSFSALAEIPTLVFEPLKGKDLISWKDPSDWVFIEPWSSLKMVRSFAEFQNEFDIRIAKVLPAPPKISAPVVAWEGSFVDYGSLSHINRELTARLGKGIALTPVGPNALNANAQKDPAMVRCARTLAAEAPANTAVTVRHQWPPNWSRPASGLLVVIQPWEYGSLPKAWLEQASNVDEFWVPSPQVRHMYVDSGVAPEKVRVVPNGVDTQKFRPGVKALKLATKKKFKFLFVGGTIFRKGPDVLLDAYVKAFTAADDVCLVVKDFGGDSCYQGQTAEAAIRAIQQKPNAPEILYLNRELASEEMPALYAACDCFVLPYRGEGFGMPVLEAMACGLPVIVTGAGATESFVPQDGGWKIAHRYQLLNGRVGEIPLVKSGWLLEPSRAHLTLLLRHAAAHPDECRRFGAVGRATVERRFDWQHIAAIVRHRLGELAEQAHRSGAVVGKPTVSSMPVVSVKPAVARIGQLTEARELFAAKNFPAAWEATQLAISRRPFHPEAAQLLAEIALAAGDARNAKTCAEHARKLAPGWETPKKFLGKKLSGDAKLDWINTANFTPRAPRLSICLITKNEEKFLAQCLKSVRALNAQIIVADTGSTDRTVEIAREFGAEVYSFAWCDDFSAARNAALEHATGDWVLMLDADEELPPDQHAKLRADMQHADTLALRLPLVNVGQEIEGRSFVPRLFRNAPEVFFHGRIHEQVFASLLANAKRWGLKTDLGTAQLLHHGYTKELVRDRNKVERNLQLLRLGVAENPADANLMMNFGMELVRSGDLTNGLEKYRAAFRLLSAQPPGEAPEVREALLSQFTSQLYKVRGHDEVVRVLTSPLARQTSLTASLHLALGLSQFELKNYPAAAEQMRACIAKKDQPALTPVNVDIFSAAPWHCLALCAIRAGNLVEAEKAFAQAVAAGGRANEARVDFAKFLAEQARPTDALQQVHAAISTDPQCVPAWRLGGQLALSQPQFLEFALDWTGEAVRNVPADFNLQAQRAETLLLVGRTAEAAELWRSVWENDHEPRSLAALILCAVVEGQLTATPRAGVEETNASRAFVGWYQRLVQYGGTETIQRVNDHLPALTNSLPTAAQLLLAAMAEAQAATLAS